MSPSARRHLFDQYFRMCFVETINQISPLRWVDACMCCFPGGVFFFFCGSAYCRFFLVCDGVCLVHVGLARVCTSRAVAVVVGQGLVRTHERMCAWVSILAWRSLSCSPVRVGWVVVRLYSAAAAPVFFLEASAVRCGTHLRRERFTTRKHNRISGESQLMNESVEKLV